MPKVCAIVPAYNEEKTIRELVKRLKRTLPEDEVVVIDDFSKDRTADFAKKAGAVVISHEKNKGKASGVLSGLSYAKKIGAAAVLIIDADMQYAPELARVVLDPIEKNEADFVMGFRDFSKVPFRHSLGNFATRTIFNLFFGTKFPDTNCGLIAFGKKGFDVVKVVYEGYYGGYLIEPAMLIEGLKMNLRIKHVPVEVSYHQVSKVARGIRMILGLLVYTIRRGIDYRLHGWR
ncbi:MAG TPA: glycosyltransferase family 2 protein [archaeon]|nr:glycosyltransferase family 2 protein [archaeon]